MSLGRHGGRERSADRLPNLLRIVFGFFADLFRIFRGFNSDLLLIFGVHFRKRPPKIAIDRAAVI